MNKTDYIHFKDINPLLSIRRNATGLNQPDSVDGNGFLYSGDIDGT